MRVVRSEGETWIRAPEPDGHEHPLMAGTRSTRTAAVWRASFDRQVCGIEIGIT